MPGPISSPANSHACRPSFRSRLQQGGSRALQDRPSPNGTVSSLSTWMKMRVPFDAAPDRDDSAPVDNWPLADLRVGHSVRKLVACNWKVFWENYNECLHCAHAHPELSDIVPIYSRGLLSQRDDPNWRAQGDTRDPRLKGGLKIGAETWSMDGRALPYNLSEADAGGARRRPDLFHQASLDVHGRPMSIMCGSCICVRLAPSRPSSPPNGCSRSRLWDDPPSTCPRPWNSRIW